MKKRVLLFGIGVFRCLYGALYAALKCLPLQNKVVMMSRQSDEVRPDFTQIADALSDSGCRASVVFLCRTLKTGSIRELLSYGVHLLRCAYHLATSRVCVVDGYEIPVSMLHHRKALFVVQVWHSLGAVKKFGLQSLSKSAGRDEDIAEKMSMHKNYDCVLAASRRTAEIYAEAFGVKREQVLVLGTPRIDAILRLNPAKCRERLLKKYPELRGKRIVLHVPTFRRGTLPETAPLASAAKAAGFGLITRLHPLDLEKSENRDGLLACEDLGTFTLMAAADDIVTDYSAISIEASLLDKRLWFFVPDIEEYDFSQGLNLNPLREMPGCSFRDVSSLIAAMQSDTYDAKALRAFRDTLVETQDTHCAERIAALIREHCAEDAT